MRAALLQSEVCRKVRESRVELRKFMREVKRHSPAAVLSLQYDKAALYLLANPAYNLLILP